MQWIGNWLTHIFNRSACLNGQLLTYYYWCAGGGLAFVGYLALLCQVLIAWGRPQEGRAGVPTRQQYEQLPMQEGLQEDTYDGKAAVGQKDGPHIVELTATAANAV